MFKKSLFALFVLLNATFAFAGMEPVVETTGIISLQAALVGLLFVFYKRIETAYKKCEAHNEFVLIDRTNDVL